MASPDMLPICSTDTPLPQPDPIDALKASLAASALALSDEAAKRAVNDPSAAVLLLDSASRAYSAIS